MKNQHYRHVVALTGGTSGIGRATVESLLARDAHVIAVGRDPERCRAAEQTLRERYPDARLDFIVADLSTTSEISRAAGEIRRIADEHGRLDALVHNAAFVSTWRITTAEGYEKQFVVNYLAGFLLTRELLPCLESGKFGRVICVSSGSHRHCRIRWDDPMLTRRYNALRAYKQSKLAEVLFCMEFNRRRPAGQDVTAYAFDPGLVRTEIGLKGLSGIEHWFWGVRSRSRSAVDPSVPAVHLADLATVEVLPESEQTYRFRGVAAKPDRVALDAVSGARLWALSERLCSCAETEVW